MPRRVLAKIVFFLGLLVAFVIGWHYFSIYKFSTTPLVVQTVNHEPVIFNVTPGICIETLAQQLYHQGIIKDPKKFVQLANLRGVANRIQAGEYSIPSGITPQDLLTKFIRGDIVLHRFTIIEGWTFKQVMQALSNNPAVKHTLSDNSAKAVMAALGHAGQNPEGLFFPDTYLFKRGIKDVALLQMSYRYMQKRLNKAWSLRDPKLPYKNSYQALIAASLIEKESKLDMERPTVGGVIVNRMHRNMLLQIDAAVIYGLGENYQGKLTRSSLHTKTPYNTYINKGLPPTPIAMPSQSAMNAALHPTKTKALYYVAKGDGSHAFSNNLQSHQKAVKQYLSTKKTNTISLSVPLATKFWLNLVPPVSKISQKNIYDEKLFYNN